MDPQGQHQAIPTISIPDASSMEFLESGENVYTIVASNRQQFSPQQQFQMTSPVKQAQIVYNQAGIPQQLQIVQSASNHFQQQQLQQQQGGPPRAVQWPINSPTKMLISPHLIKVMPHPSNNGNVIMVAQPQLTQIRNVQEYQERIGVNFGKQQSPKACRVKEVGQVTPPRPIPSLVPPLRSPLHQGQPIAYLRTPGQGSQMPPQLTPLRPVLTIARPASATPSPGAQRVQEAVTPPKQSAAPSPSVNKPQQIITSGNKNFNIINSKSCKAVPCLAPGESNGSPVVESDKRPVEQVVHTYSSPVSSGPKLPSILTKNTVSVATKPIPSPREQPSVPKSVPTPSTSTPIKPTEEVKIMPGKVAVCLSCGFSSMDLNKCQRCRRSLAKAKIVDDPSLQPKPKATSTPKSYLKQTVKSVAPLNKHAASPPIPSTSKNKSSEQQSVARQSPVIIKGKKYVPTSVRKVKAVEEPVCLTISDDEDEGAKPKLPLPTTNAAVEQRIALSKESDLSPVIKSKEPTVEQLTESDNNVPLSLGIANSLIESYQKGLGAVGANLTCRTVRIGSYKEVPLGPVLICPEGLQIGVPHPETKVPVVLEIPRSSVTAVLAHLGRTMPVLFVYLKCSAADRIRQLLGMADPNKEPYFDPLSKNETHKRITLLPEKISDEAKLIIKRIFSKEHGRDAMTILEAKEANAILVKASPVSVEVAQGLKGKFIEQVKQPAKEETKELFVYPKPPIKGGVPITTDDYLCLGEEQFLNDAIVDFYFKYLALTKLSEKDQARTHIFSSFFYRRLTTRQLARKSEPNEVKMTPNSPEQRHSRVKSWTKNVDIFEKDFIFIPINEHAHWFLAVICFPGLEGPVRLCDGQPVSAAALKRPTVKVTVQGSPGTVKQYTIGDTTVTIAHTPSTTAASLLKKKGAETVISLEDSDGSERDEAEGDEEEFANSEDEAEAAEVPKEPEVADAYVYPPNAIKQPCILIFDSLATNARNRVVATLRDYLRIEYKSKKGEERIFNRDTIRGALPRVPQQNNFTDCGVFMLQYAESFFETPIRDFTLPLKNVRTWFNEETIRGKRESLARLIQQMMGEQSVDVKLPELTFPKPLPKDAIVVEVIPAGSVAVETPATSSQASESATSLPAKNSGPEGANLCPNNEQVEVKQEAEPEMVLPDLEVEAEGAGMVSLSVVVPEEHVLPVPMASDSEIVVSEEPNDSGASGVDPENMNHCIELVDNLFRDDDMEVDNFLDSSVVKRKAEDDAGSTSSPKRPC